MEDILDDVAHRLLRVDGFELGGIDATVAEAEVRDMTRKILKLSRQALSPEHALSPEEEQHFIEDVCRRFQETYAPGLLLGMRAILAGAFQYGVRGLNAEILGRFDEIPDANAFERDEEEALFFRYAEKMRVQGVLHVALNWEVASSIVGDFFDQVISQRNTKEDSQQAWESLSSREKKHLQRRLGDSPVEKTHETKMKVEQLSEQRWAQMRADFIRVALSDFKDRLAHVINCATSANLLLTLVYLENAYDIKQGLDKQQAQLSLPGVEELKDVVGKRLVDWLIHPLPKRPKINHQGKADLSRLRQMYDENIEDWREAFAFARDAISSRSARRRQNWKDEVKRNYPLYQGHNDLIEQLAQPSHWSDVLTAQCEEQGAESKPKDICLEYAARLCGAEPRAYKMASLQKTYNRQNRIGKN